MMKFIYSMGDVTVKTYLSHPNVQKLMKSGEVFDICILENFNTEAMMGLVDTFNCTLITYTSFVVVTWIDDMSGNISPASYVPHPFLDYNDKMTLPERLINAMTFNIEKVLYHFVHLPNQQKFFKKYFPNARRSLDEIRSSSAVIFMNNHVSASSPRPYLPHMIEIGGIHVRPANPLPKDVQEYLDSATDGAIVFSMGSIIQASKWPEQKREAFVKAFGKLKFKVLWKYENETLPNKPENVMISPWIPQRDALAHPNVKLFISHGGKLGTTEAFYQGVPVLGVPVYGDQMMNMAKFESHGNSIQILYEDINEKVLSEALNEILNNPKYMENAKKFAVRFKDRPLTPRQSVVYWTEFTARNKDFNYLKSTASDMNFIQLHLIDVYFVIFSAIAVVLLLIYKCVKFLLSSVKSSVATSVNIKKSQ
ncbi:UDP-glycosyltransferase UGT5-like [Chironomus tepperi]|uniref:UDP-glycosyltransferase UGT5-like n=1 Tax=Chironomus tepperi TaxID=113505 RepID=UPI00391F9940